MFNLGGLGAFDMEGSGGFDLGSWVVLIWEVGGNLFGMLGGV